MSCSMHGLIDVVVELSLCTLFGGEAFPDSPYTIAITLLHIVPGSWND